MAYVDWSISGPEIANCNCDVGCPCQFMALPTHGDCRAMTAMRIEKGHFGDVDLGGVSWCGMFAWPKAIHEGNGEAFVVISEHATPAQRDALLTILSGRELLPARQFSMSSPQRSSRCTIRSSRRWSSSSIWTSGRAECGLRTYSTQISSRYEIRSPARSIARKSCCLKDSNTAKPSSPAAARARSAPSTWRSKIRIRISRC